MLYDQRWDKKVEADPFSLDSLIAWLETMPANGTYNFVCIDHCLLAMYFRSHGYEQINMGPKYFHHAAGTDDLPAGFNKVALGEWDILQNSEEWTFGAALTRARALRNTSSA